MQSTFEGNASTTLTVQALKNNEALYTVNISKLIGSEYIEMCNDIARFAIIQVAIQLMLYILNPNKFSFFSKEFFVLLLFIIIGVLLYWLVFKKIVTFK